MRKSARSTRNPSRAGSWRRRSGCQGAAARSVSMRLRRAPFLGSPGLVPAGRPRVRPVFCETAPAPAFDCASRRPASSAASSPSGRDAFTASSSMSESSCGEGAVSSLSVSPDCESGGGGASGSCSSTGKWRARGASTRAAARRASSSVRSRPASAAATRAARSAITAGRTEAMPRASAVRHSPSVTAVRNVTAEAKRARLRCSMECHFVRNRTVSIMKGDTLRQDGRRACSSSMPSSSDDRNARDEPLARFPLVHGGGKKCRLVVAKRSAEVSSNTPPLASAISPLS
jgi:hypothetical protein